MQTQLSRKIGDAEGGLPHLDGWVIGVNFSKLKESNKIFRNDCVFIPYHLSKISTQNYYYLKMSAVKSCERVVYSVHPIGPKSPVPQYQPIDRKKRKGKKVEDYSRDRAA